MGLPLIKVVQLTVTNRCQCQCKHCGVAKLRRTMKEELSLDQIETLFQDLRLAGVLVVDLFGGEPTLRDDLFHIIRRGKACGFLMSLETNGYVIDEPYMKGLVEAGLDQIYLSLDDYRAEVHDEIRGRKGCFDRALRALELGVKAGIIMHVSTVPPGREAFINGDMNRFMEFVLERGAQQVRLLLPRFAGESIHGDEGPLYAGEEENLFSQVAAEYHPYIYVHTPGTAPTEKNVCTAKQVFCHIMSNGLVMPCPYFPLVFGDALREPVVDVFERIQSHPLVRLGGESCPMRNGAYIDTHLRELGLDRPFFPITTANLIDLGAPCDTACPGCSYGTLLNKRDADSIIKEIKALSPHYTRVEFYGGDAFRRNDLEKIFEQVPRHMKISLWTSCGPDTGTVPLEIGASYPLEAVKIRLALPPEIDPSSSNATAATASVNAALDRAASLASRGIPIYLYVETTLMDRIHGHLSKALYQTGVERLYSFARNEEQGLTNAVCCFGKEMERFRLLWARQE